MSIFMDFLLMALAGYGWVAIVLFREFHQHDNLRWTEIPDRTIYRPGYWGRYGDEPLGAEESD